MIRYTLMNGYHILINLCGEKVATTTTSNNNNLFNINNIYNYVTHI